MRNAVLRSILFALGLTALAVVAGCGSDDETASLTRAQFIKQANAVCIEGEKERGKLIQGASKLVKPGEELSKAGKEEFVITAAVEPYRKMTRKIEELGAPEGDEQEVEAIIKAMEEAADKAEANPQQTIDSIIPFAEANRVIGEYGIESCVV